MRHYDKSGFGRAGRLVKEKKMKAKKKSIITLVVFFLCVVLSSYTVVFGLIDTAGAAKNIKLGLDLAGGVSVTYEIQGDNVTETQIKDTLAKLQQRVEKYSTEAEVYQEGDNRITVEIPAVDDANAVLEDLGTPGALEFYAPDGETVLLTGSDVSNAYVSADNSGAVTSYVVGLELTSEGATKFAEATEQYLGQIIYIVYDGEAISYPVVEAVISNGVASISGMENYEAADYLATHIRIGALPVELKELRSQIVGAKLGQDAIDTTLLAGAIGLGIVCIIMIVIYLFQGVVATLSLITYVLLMLLALNGFNVTLTLPGLAGIILSIGMAVDANVIIYTRIKEEIGNDVSVRTAIQNGFSKAFSAIFDGNVTTLIAAAVLWWRGTGSIKGFAQTLAIGIVLSMVTALFITKHLMKAFFELGVQDKKFYGIQKKVKVKNYAKFSKVAYLISFVGIVLGFVFLPINKDKTGQILNYSLEFKGGSTIEATYDKAYTVSEAETVVVPVIAEAAGVSVADIQVQPVEDSNTLIIKTTQLSDEQRQNVETALVEKFAVTDFSSESISSVISSEMRLDAFICVIIATICMLVYIIFRFKDVRFGASAVLALVHDVLIVFTVYSVARLSVGNTFIACMLTIVGYSINATIIIFDRIRENLGTMGKSDLKEVVNASISQTFTRTIYTSLTTFVMVLVLYIIGVPSIKEFALTLMAGILCGAYSSVCITGPLWLLLKKIGTKKKKTAMTEQ